MLRVFEAFAGYGSQSIALRNLGIDYEVVAISEIDKYAIKGYEAIHGEVNNLGDITKIKLEDIPKHDLFTYSFPCQDISVAGKTEGIVRGKTRSGLLYECERIIEHCKPKYLLMENVKNLVGKKFKPQFDEWLDYLEGLGYTNYWQVLNAKDYGVPQNRERVFVVSILGEHKLYDFPKKIRLEKSIKDILEKNVEEKYYLSKEVQDNFTPILNSKNKKNEIIKVGNASKCKKSQAGTVVSDEGVSMTICAGTHGYAIGYILNKLEKVERTPLKFLKRNGKKMGEDYCFCVDTSNTGGVKEFYSNGDYRIRKLTPRECFRLMGLSEADIDKIQETRISNTQQYKLAGNSIVVDVLESIFRELFLN